MKRTFKVLFLGSLRVSGFSCDACPATHSASVTTSTIQTRTHTGGGGVSSSATPDTIQAARSDRQAAAARHRKHCCGASAGRLLGWAHHPAVALLPECDTVMTSSGCPEMMLSMALITTWLDRMLACSL